MNKKIYGSKCKNCGHRIGAHFFDVITNEMSCNGSGGKPCNCTCMENDKIKMENGKIKWIVK